MSPGVPSRPAGVWRVVACLISGVIHPVSIGPGLTTLARMPRDPSSTAAAMTMRSRAPLLAPYGRLWAAWSLVSAMIRPGHLTDVALFRKPFSERFDQQPGGASVDGEMSFPALDGGIEDRAVDAFAM